MAYGRGGNDGVLLRRSGKHIRTAHWSASPHHSPLSHSHQHQPTTPILSCPSTILLLIWTTSSACSMGSPPPFPLLMARLRPTLPLLVLGVVRLPDLLTLPVSLVNQSPPPSPSMSTDTSSAGEIASSLTLSSQKSADGLKARPFAMICLKTYIFGTSFMLGRWFGGTGTGM